MEVTRADDDGDMFVESEFTVQCNSERNRRSGDSDSARLIQLCDFLARASDDSFYLGLLEKKVVSDIASGDCIGTCGECHQSGW